jgi:DNA repair exonuclease SbcCD ATPase subunit
MKASERIKEIENRLKDYKELLKELEEIDTIYETLDWVDIYKPHHIGMELSQAIYDVEKKIQEIESKLERI